MLSEGLSCKKQGLMCQGFSRADDYNIAIHTALMYNSAVYSEANLIKTNRVPDCLQGKNSL